MNSRRCSLCGVIVDGGLTSLREHLRTGHDHDEIARALSERILACPACGSERVESGETKRQCWKCGNVWRPEAPKQQYLGEFAEME